MRWIRRSVVIVVAAVVAAAASSRAEQIIGLTINDVLVKFDSATPGTTFAPVPVTGLQAGESLLAIDLRPATRELYGLGSTSRLYTIDVGTGVATQVGSAGPFTLSGTAFGFDFDPVADEIRVVSDTDQNLRLDPNDGTIVQTDATLAYGAADPNFGANPHIVGAAYGNNVAGALATTLYAVDSVLRILVRLDLPDDGTLSTVGSLGLGFLLTDDLGLDISGLTGTAYAMFTGTTGGGLSQLSIVDTSSGDSGGIGGIGGGTIVDIAAPVPEPACSAELAAGVVAFLRRRRPARTG